MNLQVNYKYIYKYIYNKTSEFTSKVTSKVTLQDDLQDNLQDSFRTEGAHHAGVGTKRLCAAADPTALRASPATVPGFRPPKVGWEGVPANLGGNTSSTSWVGRCDGKLGWEHVPPKFYGTCSHPSLLQPLPTQLNMGRVPTQVPPWKNDGKILQKTNQSYKKSDENQPKFT